MKKAAALFLALALCLSLCTVAFAAGSSFAITNGTPESAKETNHGYIAIDKATATEFDTVTVEAHPADGYRLKSLTVAPTGFVDLGIKDAEDKPLYWKETNLGASNPQDPGNYYMWGATALMYSAVNRSETSDTFTFVTENPYGDNYQNTWDASLGFNFNNVPFADGVFKNNDGERNVFTKYTTIDKYAKSGTPDNITTLQPEDDAATAKNANWHTPTYDELVALATNCVLVWTSDYNNTGNAGYIVYKAKNDTDKGKVNMNGTWKMWDAANSKYIPNTGSAPTGYSTSDIHIFLPAAGYGNDTKLVSKNTAGAYCSSDLNKTNNHSVGAVNFNKSAFNIAYNYFRSYGFSIRPVMSFSGITPAKQQNGTYQFTMPGYAVTVTAEFEEKAITIADILPDDFPTCVDVLPPNVWVNGNKVNMMVIPYSLVIFTLDGDGNPDYVTLADDIRTATLTESGNNYTYTNNGVTTTFLMSDNGLESVKIEGLTGDYVDFNGTYGAPPTKYTVTNGTTDMNGYITIDKANAAKGETVTITVTPAEGYQLKKLTVLSAISIAPPITPAQDAQDKTKYTFKMPSYPVRVTAVFEENSGTGGGNPNPGHGYSAPSGHLVTSDLTSVTKVTVDGKAVDSKYYTVSGGNVTLTDAFMKTLANGKHTVKLYNGDVVATGTMTVSGNAAVVSAKTADAGIALYGVLSVSSLLGMGWVSKKKH